MARQRPITEQGWAYEVTLGDGAPDAGVAAVVAVVTHGKILLITQIDVMDAATDGAGVAIAAVAVHGSLLGTLHDALEAELFGFVSIVHELGGNHFELVSRDSGEALDIMLCALLKGHRDATDVFGGKDKDFTARGGAEMVAEFVH